MLEHLKKLVAAGTARTGKRRTIRLTDDTLRDGQQCLWATRMRTEHMLPIAERMDRAGFSRCRRSRWSSSMRACCS
jgi:oxaloacetate decarboxylase alpha subunit